MTLVLGAADAEVALVFIEIGAVALVLAALARFSARIGITAIPFYLLAGLLVGEGGIAPLDVSADFIETAAEIGVLLLLLTLGLEYGVDELRQGLRAGAISGVVDALVNFTPGFVAGLLLGWDLETSLLLGGVCWISSSGVVSKVLADLDRLGNRETPSVLNLLVLEDLAMAAYLPLVAALLADQAAVRTAGLVAIALAAVAVVLLLAFRWGHLLGRVLETRSDEALLLSVFGLTLLVGGLAQEIQVSAAIGAFLVGVVLSGPVRARASEVVAPLRDLFAATFFLFFSFQIRPSTLASVLLPALLLVVVTVPTKFVSGGFAATRAGVGPAGSRRAGAVLVARGEFSIVIASLGTGVAQFGDDLGALAAGYVLLTAVAGPLLAKYSDRLPTLRSGGRFRPAR